MDENNKNRTDPPVTAPPISPPQQPIATTGDTTPLATGSFPGQTQTPAASTPQTPPTTPGGQQSPFTTPNQTSASQNPQIPSLGTMPTTVESPQPDTSVEQAPQTASDAIITGSKKSGNKFKILVIFLIIVAVAVYGVVGYLYFNNSKIKEEASNQPAPAPLPIQDQEKEPTTTPEPTAIPLSQTIVLLNGSIVREIAGVTTTLIDKEDYESTGIAGFSEVAVSPNEEYFCFASTPPVLDPNLYYSSIDGKSVTMISAKGRGCTWSNSSDGVAYTKNTDRATPSDIFVYSLTAEVETNLTKVTAVDGVYRRYEITDWTADDTFINCTYEQIDLADTSNEVFGNCQVDVATSEVTNL